jgi:hypothetical protein
VPLGRNHARPSRTARARPTTTRGMTRVRGAGAARVRGPRPRGARPGLASAGAARVAHDARRRCSASRWWHGTGAREAAEDRRLTDAGMANGGAASTGEASVRTAARSAMRRAVGATVGRAMRSGDGRRGRGNCWGDGDAGEAVGRRAARARQSLSSGRDEAGAGERGGCRGARRAVPTAALSRGVGTARGGHAATVRCRGPGAARGV